jgi:small subunit ribosomal protein S17
MKTLIGKVVSLKTDKTASVLVETQWKHPLYGKYVKRSKKFACHLDENSPKLELDDEVEIAPIRPVSKTKRHKVVQKIEQ